MSFVEPLVFDVPASARTHTESRENSPRGANSERGTLSSAGSHTLSRPGTSSYHSRPCTRGNGSVSRPGTSEFGTAGGGTRGMGSTSRPGTSEFGGLGARGSRPGTSEFGGFGLMVERPTTRERERISGGGSGSRPATREKKGFWQITPSHLNKEHLDESSSRSSSSNSSRRVTSSAALQEAELAEGLFDNPTDTAPQTTTSDQEDEEEVENRVYYKILPTEEEHMAILARPPKERSAREVQFLYEFAKRNFDYFRKHEADVGLQLCRSMRVQNCYKGQCLFKFGEPGSTFYIVHSGQCTVMNRAGALINQVLPGGSFGEIALIKNQARGATVVVTKPSLLFTIERSDYNRILKSVDLALIRSKLLLIKRLPGFSDLPTACAERMSFFLEKKKVQRGNVLLKEGEVADRMVFVHRGSLVVTKSNPAYQVGLEMGVVYKPWAGGVVQLQPKTRPWVPQETNLVVLGECEMVGEECLLKSQAYLTTVTVADDAEVFILPHRFLHSQVLNIADERTLQRLLELCNQRLEWRENRHHTLIERALFRGGKQQRDPPATGLAKFPPAYSPPDTPLEQQVRKKYARSRRRSTYTSTGTNASSQRGRKGKKDVNNNNNNNNNNTNEADESDSSSGESVNSMISLNDLEAGTSLIHTTAQVVPPEAPKEIRLGFDKPHIVETPHSYSGIGRANRIQTGIRILAGSLDTETCPVPGEKYQFATIVEETPLQLPCSQKWDRAGVATPCGVQCVPANELPRFLKREDVPDPDAPLPLGAPRPACGWHAYDKQYCKKANPAKRQSYIVKLTGLPWWTTKASIKNFLRSISTRCLKGIYMGKFRERDTDCRAFVVFTSQEDADKAVRLHRRQIDAFTVNVYHSSEVEMMEYINERERSPVSVDLDASPSSTMRLTVGVQRANSRTSTVLSSARKHLASSGGLFAHWDARSKMHSAASFSDAMGSLSGTRRDLEATLRSRSSLNSY